MHELFLNLKQSEQAQILNTIGSELGRPADILEKDVWLCWALEHLFKMPGHLPMAFKGGTSYQKFMMPFIDFQKMWILLLIIQHLIVAIHLLMALVKIKKRK
jgi:hypothetical protein